MKAEEPFKPLLSISTRDSRQDSLLSSCGVRNEGYLRDGWHVCSETWTNQSEGSMCMGDMEDSQGAIYRRLQRHPTAPMLISTLYYTLHSVLHEQAQQSQAISSQ